MDSGRGNICEYLGTILNEENCQSAEINRGTARATIIRKTHKLAQTSRINELIVQMVHCYLILYCYIEQNRIQYRKK